MFKSRSGGIWLAALVLTTQACKLEPVPTALDTTCLGPNCADQDAALTLPSGFADAAPAPAPTTTAPPSSDAGAELCPGECLPDDARACLPPVSSVSLDLQLSISPSAVPAQVLPGPDAGAALPSIDAGGVGQGGSPGSADAGASLSGDASIEGPFGDASLPGVEGTESDDSALDDGAQGDAAADDAGGGYQTTLPGELDVVGVDAGVAQSEPDSGMLACQLQPAGAGVRASCGAAGAGTKDTACNSAADCAPGLACVADLANIGGLCLPTCCAGDSSCEVGFCGRRPLKTAQLQSEAPLVPVCVPSEQCDLMDPFPCEDGNCKCPAGAACAPVGRDGARHCVQPGLGEDGAACPCAAGYFCSAQQQCLRLCQLGSDTCGGGSCQALSGFPEQWGLCLDQKAMPGAVP